MPISLNTESQEVITGKDSIVVPKVLLTIRGGRALNTTGLPDAMKVISAGHVIIVDNATGEDYRPMPVNAGNTAYAALPTGFRYIGIQIQSVLKSQPAAGILTAGQVNHKACPYPMDSILDAIRTALPRIEFQAD